MPDTTDSNKKVKKSKSFKRIRGFLRGESRKERRAKKEAARKEAAAKKKSRPSSSNLSKADDESTVYGVDVDDRSVATRQSDIGATASSSLRSSSNNKTFMLKVVLLLMDPKTRRFELLQLEFDSKKALVQDVLAQIPVSVTEEVLRQQTYTGICSADAQPMLPKKLLADFCKGSEVLVAIPTGVQASECARLAKPILGDDKVVAMLAASGIDATSWKEEAKKKAASPQPRAAPATPIAVEPEEPVKKKEGGFSWFLLLTVLAVMVQVFHVYISAPIKPGHTVAPGIWLSKCGVLALLPSCENAYFYLDYDGRVTVYDEEKQVSWEMQGSVCADGEDCTKGLTVEENGAILIGGKKVAGAVLKSKEASLSPWPFAEEPKVKLFKKY